MTDWKPIETAPKEDHLRLLGIDDQGHVSTMYGYVWGGKVEWHNESDINREFDNCSHEQWSPTHWMPLPERPAT